MKADKLYPHQLALVRARFDLARLALENQALRARLAGSAEAGAALEGRACASWTGSGRRWWRPIAPRCSRREPRRAWPSAAGIAGPGRGRRGAAPPCRRAGRRSPSRAARCRRRSGARSSPTSPTPGASSPRSPGRAALRRVPEIAYAHHEKLDGHGYPRGMPAERHPGGGPDDDHRRRLRRAHRQRPALQEGAPAPRRRWTSSRRRPAAGSSTPGCSGVFVGRAMAAQRRRGPIAGRKLPRAFYARDTRSGGPGAASGRSSSIATAGSSAPRGSWRRRPTTAPTTAPRTPASAGPRGPRSCSGRPAWPTST